MKEFELINHYFKGRGVIRKDVEVGIGDDCALLSVPDNHHLAVTTDTLVENVHFFSDICPKALGHRVLAVNLSDLAAMGAEPTWVSVALTLPKVDLEWLESFTDGLFEIAEYHNVQVIGGDTTQGPLSITISAKGIVPKGKALRRSGAKVGDWIYVTGPLGDAGLAVESRLNPLDLPASIIKKGFEKLHFPSPRVAAGQVLRGLANSAIDISDGLVADIQHILRASSVGAQIIAEYVPTSAEMKQALPESEQLRLALTFGDDYELLFTVSEDNKYAVEQRLKEYGVEPVCIGQITSEREHLEVTHNNQPWQCPQKGFEHFS